MPTRLFRACGSILVLTLLACNGFAQQSATGLASASTAVPNLINFNGTLPDALGKLSSVTFLLYKDQTGGSPLWMETQNITPTKNGQYTATLGVTKPHGLPADVFATGEARWLAVQVSGEPEQPRVLLVAVPYALKAADAETIGGLPPSAFVLTPALRGSTADNDAPAPNALPPAAIGGTGTTGSLPVFTAASTLGNSAIFQSGTGTTAKIGINTNAPGANLDVVGTATIRGQLTMPSNGIASATAGKPSQALEIRASSFNSGTNAAVAQNFLWQAAPTNNNTTAPGGTLNLLYAAGTGAPAQTGLKISPRGVITFAAGQTFPGGGGGGTITGVTAGADLTGGGATGNVTLNLDTTKVPQLNTANTFTGTQTTNGNQVVVGLIGVDTATPEAELDIEPNHAGGQLILLNGGEGAWSINSFGGSNDGLAGRFIAGSGFNGLPPGSGIAVGGGSSDNSTAGGFGGYFGGGFSSAGTGGDGIDATAGNTNTGSQGWAGNFTGSVNIAGTLFASAKSFRIDHPLDPANKYLNHASTESSEMMNIYSGNVVTDKLGLATVSLPSWFEVINTDFRYQLTVVGEFAQAIIRNKIAAGHFTIMTNVPAVEVSWMITAIRQDPYARANPLVVEELKPARERGFYQHPELYGQPDSKQTEHGRHPQVFGMMQETGRGQRPSHPKTATGNPASHRETGAAARPATQ
jgi:hypothetical protein